ncbi:MAG TPA: tyrosinase family protein [Thermoanaerobaculia bacterium]
MSLTRSTRRHFLKKSGVAASFALFSGPILDFLGVTEDAFAAYVRPNVKGLTAASPTIVSYKKGIAAMKALPAGNPLNWNAWANIHGIGPIPPSGSNPLWNTCQHGHWWFLPWHRMYLWYFELAIRKFSGDPNFALPFWDYSDPTQRALPSMFRTPTVGNALYVSARNATLNAGGMLTPSTVDYTTAFSFTNFTGPTGSAASFGSQTLTAPNHGASPHGQLESRPHDSVHVAIGGWMGSFGTAARDPIFWLHHANIDRLWDLWLTTGGGRADPNVATWCNQSFQFFDPSGATVAKKVSGVINALPQLGYSYQGVPAVPTQKCGPFITTFPFPVLNVAAVTLMRREQPLTLGEQPATVSVPIDATASGRMLQVAKDPKRSLVLRLEGIEVTAPPGIIYEVYIGLPATAPPDPKSPHYVGNVAPFGAEMHQGEFVQAFPIDAAAERVLAASPKQVDIRFVPRAPLDANGREVPPKLEGRVTFKRMRVITE